MSVDRLEIRVSITKLLLALIIIIVPLSIIGLALTEQSDQSLDNAVGANFKTMAQLYASDVSRFMVDSVAAVNSLANDPSVVSAVTSGPKGKAGMDANASQVLKQRQLLDPRFLSIVATNDGGQVVASSQPAPKTSYAQDAGWQAAYNNGNGATKIGDIVDDEFTKSYYVTMNVPVASANGGPTAGVVSAKVNLSEVLNRFRQEGVGNGARASLVGDDGKIISAPNADVFARISAPEFDFVRDSLTSAQGGQNGWVMADVGNRKKIVGYAGLGLKQHFPNLGWFVTVSQDEHQAAAPVRQLQHFALGMVILAVFMLTLLFVYYYLHRAQGRPDIEQELAREAEERHRTATASV
jgi:hypothetical protein